jgi:hypothetical protein
MANIRTELSNSNAVRITFAGRQGRHLRLTGSWTDWMLSMDDFRDLIIPMSEDDVDFIIKKLLNNSNKLPFVDTRFGQEYNLDGDKKIVRRLAPGAVRNEYQSVALFIRNYPRVWTPEPIELGRNKILALIRAMITLDCPANYFIADSLRNLQYLLSILWAKKKNPRLLDGRKKPKSDEIFRISLVK